MIKIKNLTKIYKTKKSENVKAIDNLSLTLQDKGLVFVLGKSGCGKSTLLNVLSGLDEFDSGDIIINGKSLKSFTQNEKDNYRNSYIGFVFQEYNLLNEFNVEDNISLSLGLQGKEPKENEISSLLKSLDLEGYEKRNISELSGGEMQRVTIARALIKNPSLIIADEPSGAVDNKTGTQIFEILKNLSKDKLVLIVSHDRDSAYTYGDRVIEMSDGKVINDYSCKTNENINFNTDIEPNNSYALKDEQLSKLEKAINNEEISISYFNRKFEKTNISDNENSSQELKLLSTKLPIKKAFKISTSTFKNKKTNLFFSVLLCLLAFTFFAIADCFLSYNRITAKTNSLYNNIDHTVMLLKDVDETSIFDITKGNYSLINNKLDKNLLYSCYSTRCNLKYENLTDSSKFNSLEKKIYPSETVNFCGTTYNTLLDNDYKLMCDTCRFPQDKYEILITDYLFYMFKKGGFFDTTTNTMYTINSCNDIINKKINILNKVFTISGVLNTNFDFDKIASYSDIKANVFTNFSFDYIVNFIKDCPPYNVIYFEENAFTNFFYTVMYPSAYSNNYKQYNGNTISFSLIQDDSNVLFFDSDKSTLNDNEIILGELSVLYKYFRTYLPKCNATGFEKEQVIDNSNIFPNYKLFKNVVDNVFRVASYKFILENTEYTKTIIKNNKSNYDTTLNDNEIDNLDLKNLLNLFCKCEVLDDTFYDFYLDYIEELRNKYDLKNYLLPKDIILLFDEKYNINNETISLIDIKNPLGEKFYSSYESICINKFACENINLCREFYEKNNDAGVFLDIDAVKFTINAIKNKQNSLVDYSKIINEFYSTKKEMFCNISEKLNFDYTLKIVNKENNEEISLNVVGLSFEYSYVVNSNNFYKFIDVDNSIGAYYMFCSLPKNKSDLRKFLEKVNTTKLEIYNYNTEIVLFNYISNELESVNYLFTLLGKILSVCSLVFAVFACLLFFNYISLSITYKKKEIGILRALGARNKDIYIIFLIESLILSVIIYILSISLSLLTISIVNGVIENMLVMIKNIFTLNLKQILSVLGMVLVLAFAGTFVNIKKISRNNPIENIRNE